MRSTFLPFSSILIACIMLMCCSAWPAIAAEPPTPAVPAATAAAWKANEAAAIEATTKQAGVTAATAPVEVQWFHTLLAYATAAGATLVLIGKLLPRANPVTGLIAGLADIAYTLISPKVQQQADAAQEDLAGAARTISHLLDQFPPDSPISALKESLAGRLAQHPLAAAVLNAAITKREIAVGPAA